MRDGDDWVPRETKLHFRYLQLDSNKLDRLIFKIKVFERRICQFMEPAVIFSTRVTNSVRNVDKQPWNHERKLEDEATLSAVSRIDFTIGETARVDFL